MENLSTTKRDILHILAGKQTPISIAKITNELNKHYTDAVGDTTLYRPLRALSESSYVDKQQAKNPTTKTKYQLTKTGRKLLKAHIEWKYAKTDEAAPFTNSQIESLPNEIHIIDLFCLKTVMKTNIQSGYRFQHELKNRYNISLSENYCGNLLDKLEDNGFITEATQTEKANNPTPPNEYKLTKTGEEILDQYTQNATT